MDWNVECCKYKDGHKSGHTKRRSFNTWKSFTETVYLSCFIVCAVVVLCSVFLCLYSLPSGVINK